MMQLNSDIFTRKLYSTIQIIIKAMMPSFRYPLNKVGTVVSVSGTYPNQKASIVFPTGTDPIPNVQNASIHTLSEGDEVYVQMIYGDLASCVIWAKKQ